MGLAVRPAGPGAAADVEEESLALEFWGLMVCLLLVSSLDSQTVASDSFLVVTVFTWIPAFLV